MPLSKDLDFLKEMRGRLQANRLNEVEQMIEDWISELQQRVQEQGICVVDSANGQYIPQIFATEYEEQIDEQIGGTVLFHLRNPQDSYYWECWETVLGELVITIDGKRYVPIHDMDVFLVPEELTEHWTYQ